MTNRPDVAVPALDQRTRILNAALGQFGAYGFKGASIRGIAAAAGVSPGLVQHHFATKEGLREECDAYVISVIQGVRSSVLSDDGAAASGSFLAGSTRELARIVPYLTRALLDGDSHVASRWFDAAAEEYRTVFTDERFTPPFPSDTDLEGVVAVYTAMQLGIAIFVGEIARHLDADPSDPTALVRLAKARIFVANQPLVSDDMRRQLEEGFDVFLQQNRQHHEPDAPECEGAGGEDSSRWTAGPDRNWNEE